MRKSLGIFILLLVLGVSAAAVGHAQVKHEGVEVEIYETALYGDETAAGGLRLDIPVAMNYRLIWDTGAVLTEKTDAETKFKFYQDQHIVSEGREDGMNIVFSSGGGGSSSGSLDIGAHAPYGMAEVFADVASRTMEGETHQEKVNYSDYRKNYPLAAEVHLNGKIYSNGYGLQGMDNGFNLDALVAPFKIPVPEDCTVDVSISKNAAGGVYEYSFHMEGGIDWIDAYSAVTEDTLYYAVDAREETDGVYTPVEGMDQWYGIYAMPYHVVKENGYEKVKAQTDQIERVLALDINERILEMMLSADGKDLLLFAEQDGMSVLKVISLETMEIRQRLELMPGDGNETTRQTILGEDMILWIRSDEQMAVMAVADNGGYTLEFSTGIGTELFAGENSSFYLNTRSMSADFNGGKLAITFPVGYRYIDGVPKNCVFYVMVYDRDGLMYCGQYQASQGIGGTYNGKYCEIRDDVRMGVSWEE